MAPELRQNSGRMIEEIRRVGISLVTEFNKLASASEEGLQSDEEALRAIHLKMRALSERVSKLEGN
jgi:hypothetical protein